MALNKAEKKHIVEDVATIAKESVGMLAANYKGMTVAEMTTLRNLASEANVSVQVVKNTLAKHALEGTDFAVISETLKGQLVFAFAKEGPGDAAKVFKDYMKKCPALQIQSLSLPNQLFEADKLDAIAALPNREQALTQLVATLQAPVVKLVRTMNEVPSKLVRTIDAVKQAKEAA